MHYVSTKKIWQVSFEQIISGIRGFFYLLVLYLKVETKEEVALSNKNGSKIEIESRTDKKDHFFSNGN